MKRNLDWLDEIDLDDILSADMKIIRDRCGIEVLKSLLLHIPKIHIYLSEKPLVEAKKRYIDKYYRQGNAKEIAVKLGVSERFVFKQHKEIIRQRRLSAKKARSLFDEEKV